MFLGTAAAGWVQRRAGGGGEGAEETGEEIRHLCGAGEGHEEEGEG